MPGSEGLRAATPGTGYTGGPSRGPHRTGHSTAVSHGNRYGCKLIANVLEANSRAAGPIARSVVDRWRPGNQGEHNGFSSGPKNLMRRWRFEFPQCNPCCPAGLRASRSNTWRVLYSGSLCNMCPRPAPPRRFPEERVVPGLDRYPCRSPSGWGCPGATG